MSDLTLLGFSKESWELFNSFANWASAAGTFAAAWVALHLANRAAKPRAAVRVGERLIIDATSTPPHPSYLMFKIVNTGDRIIRVSQIGWSVGLWKKRHAIQLYDPALSSPLPIELSHGQEASWLIPLNAGNEPWAQRFSQGMLLPRRRLAIATLRAHFHTSTGHTFVAKPEGELLKTLTAECLRLSNSSSTKP